ncbi:MAG: tRNA pseudouridine(55) synthase TruB [Thermoanaerobaculia bacterium]|nr:tRNA pseudouridine(55) synthase TruB [Thermoanaerobaculia bacterium]
MRDGLLLIDKDAGCTSHDVVQQVRRVLRQKKIGHCGTLDPDATGLLLLTLGRGTRLTRFLIRAPKVYEGEIRFGTATDTYDASGEVVREAPCAHLTTEQIGEAMHRFEGEIDQAPPPYCAKKVGGVKYYELARRGEQVPEKTKTVQIFEFAPVGDFDGETIRFRLGCSSGTYARSLAHDLGAALGTASHLGGLRRLQVGGFRVDQAVRVEELAAIFDTEPPGSAWVPFDSIPLPFEEIRTDVQQERRIAHGQTVLVNDPRIAEGDWVKVVNGRDEFVAVGSVVETIGHEGVRVVQPKIVFK